MKPTKDWFALSVALSCLMLAGIVPGAVWAGTYRLYARTVYIPSDSHNNGWDYEAKAQGNPGSGGGCTGGFSGNSAQQLYAQNLTRDSSLIALDFDNFAPGAGQQVQKVEVDVDATNTTSTGGSGTTTARIGLIGTGAGAPTVTCSWSEHDVCRWRFTDLYGAGSNGYDVTSYLQTHNGSLSPSVINGVGVTFHRTSTSASTYDMLVSGYRITVTTASTITASAGAGGTISPPGATLVPDGGTLTYTVSPDACHHIENVVVDGSSVGAAASYTFSNVTASHTISATFAPNGPFTIAVTPVGNGSVSPGSGLVDCGSSPSYAFTPAACAQVADVIVDGLSQGALPGYTFANVTANHTLVVNFSGGNPFTIGTTAGDNGTVSPNSPSVACGGSQTISITPNHCFRVADVVVDGVSKGEIGSFTFANVREPHTLVATFTYAGPFNIFAEADTDGTITPAGIISANCDDSLTFVLTPHPRHRITAVLVDGVPVPGLPDSVSDPRSYTFRNIGASHTISAHFKFGTIDVPASGGRGQLQLAAPEPNPLFSSTTIAFELPTDGEIALDILDASGRRVMRLASGRLTAGRHAIRWDGRSSSGRAAAGGLYFVRLQAPGGVLTKKLALFR